MAKKMNYSFFEGCEKVPKKYYRQLNLELKDYLCCKTRQHYYNKRKHFINMPVHVKKGIEDIFSRYNVNPEDIWTITEISNENKY